MLKPLKTIPASCLLRATSKILQPQYWRKPSHSIFTEFHRVHASSFLSRAFCVSSLNTHTLLRFSPVLSIVSWPLHNSSTNKLAWNCCLPSLSWQRRKKINQFLYNFSSKKWCCFRRKWWEEKAELGPHLSPAGWMSFAFVPVRHILHVLVIDFASLLMLFSERGPKTSIKDTDTSNNLKFDSFHVLY